MNPAFLTSVSTGLRALAPDCSQPAAHKDQSTRKYSCPGPQVEPKACLGLVPYHTRGSPARSLPDPTWDLNLAAGLTNRAHTVTAQLSWAPRT